MEPRLQFKPLLNQAFQPVKKINIWHLAVAGHQAHPQNMIHAGMYSQPSTIHHTVHIPMMKDTSVTLMSARLSKALVLLLFEVGPVIAALSTVDSLKNVLTVSALTFHSIQSTCVWMLNVQRNLFVKMESVFNKWDNALKLVFLDLSVKMESAFQISLSTSVLLSAVWKDTLVKMVTASRIPSANQMNMKLHQVVGHHVLHQNSAHVEIFSHFCIDLHSVDIQLMEDMSIILLAVKLAKTKKF